jgi:hypothetical protein
MNEDKSVTLGRLPSWRVTQPYWRTVTWAVQSPLTGTPEVDKIGATWVTALAGYAKGFDGGALQSMPPFCPGGR